MSFSIRPDRRFPICYPVTYHAGLREGHGMSGTCQRTGGVSPAMCRSGSDRPVP